MVLGESSLLPIVVEQLLLANAGRHIAIVVMADQDPADLNEEVRRSIESTHGNRLVFRPATRHGSPISTVATRPLPNGDRVER